MLGLTAVVAIGLLQASVRAQDTSHATCTDATYAWSFNSENQSPCQIGEALGNVCTSDGSFNIQYLPAGYYYSGIGATFATTCVCNTVYYSLLNVCAACQGGGVAAWNSWSANCSTAYSTFPDPIPQDTRVPHYAYLALSSNGTFDLASAQTDSGPEATYTGSTTHAPTGSNTASGSASSSTSSAGGGGGGGSSSNTGAIVGGVVGGIAALAIIAGLIFFFWRRNNKRRTTAPQNFNGGGGPESSFLGPNATGSTYTPAMPNGGFTDKVYDPNDPSTFPSSVPGTPYGQPQPQQGYSPYSTVPYNPSMVPEPNRPYSMSMSPQNTGQQPSTAYRGVAEI
ncbi:hypothetical protein BDZ89DRAFT_1136447 [Hymenopellis radicata]|nr:hypothetical protein BDZ89DRAFT_1136447 [Hymenopellis radicata]